MDHVPRQQLPLERELRLGLSEPCARASDLLGACAVTEGGDPLLERLPVGHRATEIGLGLVELGLRQRPVGEEGARSLRRTALEALGRHRPLQLVR